MNTNEFLFEFEFKRSYIEDRSLLIYKDIREKYQDLLPPLVNITNNKRKRTKRFFLKNNGEKLGVFMDFQGHVRQADGISLHTWFKKNKPEEGDSLLWYKADQPYEFLIELKKNTSQSYP